jgi:hypothetical protein
MHRYDGAMVCEEDYRSIYVTRTQREYFVFCKMTTVTVQLYSNP